jgi:hypothetical protein
MTDEEQPPEAPSPDARRTPEPASGEPSHQSAGRKFLRKLKGVLRKVLGVVKGPSGKLVAALLGFFLGVAATQVSDYNKRADDCAQALLQYASGVAINFGPTYYADHGDSNISDDKKTEITSRYAAQVDAPHDRASVKCPLDPSRDTEYLDADAVKSFSTYYDTIDKCVQWVGCPENTEDLLPLAQHAISSAQILARQAQMVSTRGLVRRAQYVVVHWY